MFCMWDIINYFFSLFFLRYDSCFCFLFLAFCASVMVFLFSLAFSLLICIYCGVTLKMFFLKSSDALWFFKFVSAFFKAFCNSFFSLLIWFIVSFINLIRFSNTLYLFLSLILFLNNCELWNSITLFLYHSSTKLDSGTVKISIRSTWSSLYS